MAALIGLAYWPALGARYIWDDDEHVTNNQAMTAPDGLTAIWFEPGTYFHQWYPLAYSTLWLNYRMSGLNPVSYHATNIVIQIVSAIALWRLLALLRCRARGRRRLSGRFIRCRWKRWRGSLSGKICFPDCS